MSFKNSIWLNSTVIYHQFLLMFPVFAKICHSIQEKSIFGNIFTKKKFTNICCQIKKIYLKKPINGNLTQNNILKTKNKKYISLVQFNLETNVDFYNWIYIWLIKLPLSIWTVCSFLFLVFFSLYFFFTFYGEEVIFLNVNSNTSINKCKESIRHTQN